VSAGDSQEGVALHRVAVERRERDVGEREEVALGGIEHVGYAAAIAVASQHQGAFDAVARRLQTDPFASLLAAVEVLREGLLVAWVAAHRIIIVPRSRRRGLRGARGFLAVKARFGEGGSIGGGGCRRSTSRSQGMTIVNAYSFDGAAEVVYVSTSKFPAGQLVCCALIATMPGVFEA